MKFDIIISLVSQNDKIINDRDKKSKSGAMIKHLWGDNNNEQRKKIDVLNIKILGWVDTNKRKIPNFIIILRKGLFMVNA
jgi:hypothetical protein